MKIIVCFCFFITILVPFLIKSRRPRSFSSTLVCVRSVFQIATSNGWCLSLKARSVEEPLVIAEWWWCVAFSSRWLSFSRWESFVVRDDRCSTWVLEIYIYIYMCYAFSSIWCQLIFLPRFYATVKKITKIRI